MKVTITSLLCNKPKYVKNVLEISTMTDLDKLIRAVVTDRSATITRADGKETEIVNVGTVRTEVYNNKELLIQWCNLQVDEFPPGGEYLKATV